MIAAGVWWGLAPLALGGLMAGLMWGLRALHTTVTPRELEVRFGPFRQRIALDRIESLRVVPFDWTEWGYGYGVRWRPGGEWSFTTRPTGDVVEVKWRTADGTERVTLVGASDPAAVIASVDRARHADQAPYRAERPVRVRIDEETAEPAEPRAEAAPLEADTAASRDERRRSRRD